MGGKLIIMRQMKTLEFYIMKIDQPAIGIKAMIQGVWVSIKGMQISFISLVEIVVEILFSYVGLI